MRKLLLLILLCLALAGCGQSVLLEMNSGGLLPAGASPIVRVDLAHLPIFDFDFFEPIVISPDRPDEVIADFRIFDYEQQIALRPGTQFFSAGIVGYCNLSARLYYHYAIRREDEFYAFVGSINVVNGSRELVGVFDGIENFFVWLMDTGDVFIMNGDDFWVYRQQAGGYAQIYQGNLAHADWVPGEASDDLHLRRQTLIDQGWSVGLTDVAPVIVTPLEAFYQLYDPSSSTEIFFIYTYMPPMVLDPDSPEVLEADEITEEMLFGGERPFSVSVLYTRRVRPVTETETETYEEYQPQPQDAEPEEDESEEPQETNYNEEPEETSETPETPETFDVRATLEYGSTFFMDDSMQVATAQPGTTLLPSTRPGFAFHVSLTNGLDIYNTTPVFTHGYRFPGYYYYIFGTDIPGVDAVLVGFWAADRPAFPADLRHAHVMLLRLGELSQYQITEE